MNIRKLTMTAMLLSVSMSSIAAPAPESPDRQTSWGLYVDSKEAYDMKTGADGKKILFVDVRDPIEIMFTGFTETVDINIPYLISNPHKWNDKKNVYAMEPNKDFESQIAKALNEREIGRAHV